MLVYSYTLISKPKLASDNVAIILSLLLWCRTPLWLEFTAWHFNMSESSTGKDQITIQLTKMFKEISKEICLNFEKSWSHLQLQKCSLPLCWFRLTRDNHTTLNSSVSPRFLKALGSWLATVHYSKLSN